MDHRSDLQRRRRPDHPVMSEDEAGLHRPGQQGAPMAKRLVEWPGGLTVFDVRAEAMTPLAEAGRHAGRQRRRRRHGRRHQRHRAQRRAGARRGRRARRARQAGHRHRDPLHDQPDTAGELADQLAPKGIHIVDAPVSGGAGAAEKGELAVMVGADDEAYERVKPVVQAVGLAGRSRRRARRGNPDEAGAQHVDLHRVRGRVRGAEAGGGRRASTCRNSVGWCATAMRRAAGPARSWSATT